MAIGTLGKWIKCDPACPGQISSTFRYTSPVLYLAGTILSHGLSLLSWHSPPGILGVRAREGYPNPPHRVMICQRTGENLLDASATWDFIQGHDLVKRGLVDLADVCERLKGKVQCSGQGLVFAEGNVIWVIETSVVKENVS